jgi:hypothetical protein
MPYKSKTFDSEPVTRPRRARLWEEDENSSAWPQQKAGKQAQDEDTHDIEENEIAAPGVLSPSPRGARPFVAGWPTLKRAHALSFAGLILFTAVTYFRPYELIPALSGFKSMAFWLAVATLSVFIPTQLSIEGTLTVRPREINLVLLLLVAALLSVPFALDPAEAWPAFVDFSKVITMFIVMVNVVRSENRLRAMIWLALIVGVVLSVYALNDYRLGHLDVRGERIQGIIQGGLFDNPNDMALHLVTMVPLALGFLFVARGLSKKLLYGLCAVIMVAGTVVSFSRGGFLALVCASFVLAWKLGRSNRMGVVVLFLAIGAIFFALVPPEYVGRLSTVFGGSDWRGGSAGARQNLLLRSIVVALRNPVVGIGMNNFHTVSIHDQVSHNAYTQVGAEVGLPALVLYFLFIWTSLKRMREIERETYDSRATSRVYYLAVGLQACLVGYMISSFFASVAYLWYIYFLVGYALCLHRLYKAKGPEGIFSRASQKRSLRPLEAPGETPPMISSREPLAAQGQH